MVRLGIDRIREFPALFRGRRLGLVTGASGLNSQLIGSVEALNDAWGLTLLFSPEHGLRGEMQPGQTAERFVDVRTGLPCVSLFGGGFNEEGGAAAAEGALEKLDAVVFDIQDAGSRYYTYASTLFYLMQACARRGKEVVVLDRPNPLGGLLLEGNTHRPENFSFIGRTPVPIRHGMTLGEMARFFQDRFHPECPLQVVPMEGWKREMYFEDTGLFFTPPSPNLPTLTSLSLYNGTCLFAGTNVSEGRVTTEPFTLVGAPWIDGGRLARRMNDVGLPGLRFAEAWFTPQFSKYQNVPCGGVRIHVTDARAVHGVNTGVHLLCAVRELFPEFAFRAPGPDGRWHIDIASGTDQLRRGEMSAEEICRAWAREAEAFRPTLEKYALY